MSQTKNDPANYRRMSEPFRSGEEANEALSAFFDEVQAARERHRIADVVVLCEVPHAAPVIEDGEYRGVKEVRGAAEMFLGDSARVLPMLAMGLGAERRRLDDAIEAMASGKEAKR